MTDVVVDASAIGAFLVPDVGGEMAARVQPLALGMAMRAPAHWPFEVMNLILKAARRHRLTEAQRNLARSGALLLFEGARVESIAMPAAAFDLAIRHHLSVYDAAYLELAHRIGLPLLSGDGALRRAAARESVPLLS